MKTKSTDMQERAQQQLLDSAQVRAEQLNGEQLLIREAIAKIEAQL